MDLNDLGLFVAAARAGSLSEAARRTGVPLPSLSRRVRRLEAHLGVRLFDRGRGGLRLTQAGTQLLADAEPPLEELGQAGRRLVDRAGIAGLLRLSVPPNLPAVWRLCAEFAEAHPAVRFDVFATERRVDLIADGVDVAFRVGAPGSAANTGRVLLRYRHRLVAAPSLLARRPVRAADDLRTVPVACWRGVGRPTWSLGGRDVPLDPVLVTNEYEHLRGLALAGDVVTELPPFLALPSIDAGDLVELLADQPFPEQPLWAIVVERRAMSPLVRAFLEHAAGRVAALVQGGP